MKLVIQIPCYNEESTLPATLADLPRAIDGVDAIEWLVIDDGSDDATAQVAHEHGVHQVVRFSANRGLAAAFRVGLQAALEMGADIVVNTDADNQYAGEDIARLVAPIVGGHADVVVGDRGIWRHPEFSFAKKCLQALGSRIVSELAGVRVPDVTSGFRALSRQAALRINVLSDYTYTHETVIQARHAGLKLTSVPIRINPQTRSSRLFGSPAGYIARSAPTILRIYALYQPLKVFLLLALVPLLAGVGLGTRFLWAYAQGAGGGHVQSLILAAVLLNLSFVLAMLGVLADLVGFNRRLMERVLVRMRTGDSSKTAPSEHRLSRTEPNDDRLGSG